MDSDSIDTEFCNPEYVSNIQDLDNPLSINIYVGLIKSHHKCNITYINDVWYNENSITKIISMKDMMEKFCIMVDLKEGPTLLVHMPNMIVKFKQFSNRLYPMDTNDENIFILTKKHYQFMNTLEENLKCLIQRQKSEKSKLESSMKR